MKNMLINILCAFAFGQKRRKRGRTFLHQCFFYVPARVLENRRQNKIAQLRQVDRKIKIVFLVTQNSKWNGEYLYKQFLLSNTFDVEIALCPVSAQSSCSADYNFFKTRGYQVRAVAYKDDLRSFKPDIVFFQQPWYLHENKHPSQVSKYALCFYFPYGCGTINNKRLFNKCKYFYKNLSVHFTFDEPSTQPLKEWGIKNCVITGHPKLDAYLRPAKKNIWKTNKFKIIYAPHHSFLSDTVAWGTFPWNGREILAMALKSLAEAEWIFKPHPMFKEALLRSGLMSEKEVQAYYEAWAQNAQIYDEGDYFDIFKTSDLLVTDCGSFLTEYLPSKKPVIHLLSTSERRAFNIVYENSSKHYYKVKNLNELKNTFDLLVKQRADPLQNARLRSAQALPSNATQNIFNYIKRLTNK